MDHVFLAANRKSGTIHRFVDPDGGTSMCGQFRADSAAPGTLEQLTCKTCKHARLTHFFGVEMSKEFTCERLLIEADEAEAKGLLIAPQVLRAVASGLESMLNPPLF